jgi:polyhydroxybutyrate depolymerase
VTTLLAAGTAGCGAPGHTAGIAAGSTGSIEVDDRPFDLHVPTGYDGGPTTLVLALHGYTSDSREFDRYLGLTGASDQRGFLLALPNGLVDEAGDRFWNALSGCCDFYLADPDDSTYLSDVISTVSATYAVDSVAVVGHSNGAFMAHRLACEHADQIDAIATLAGTLPADTSGCLPEAPVRVLDIHGDADAVVPYTGSWNTASAEDTAQTWATLDGCDPTPAPGPPADLDSSLPGSETTVTRWSTGCADGGEVQLWTIVGGAHTPTLGPAAAPAVLDFLLDDTAGA